MKNIFTLAVAVAALALFASEQASAQGYSTGYQFGTGVNQSHRGGGCNQWGGGFFSGFNRIGLDRAMAPPYFAQFPPVYYSGIVRRPYGISPYAAPAGIEPVELRAIPAEVAPVTIRNPYIKKASPVSGPSTDAQSTDEAANKTTWTSNPHFDVIDKAATLAFFEVK